MTPLEYAQSIGLIDKDKTIFVISFEDGREFELCKLLKEYASIYYQGCEQIRLANESNYE